MVVIVDILYIFVKMISEKNSMGTYNLLFVSKTSLRYKCILELNIIYVCIANRCNSNGMYV